MPSRAAPPFFLQRRAAHPFVRTNPAHFVKLYARLAAVVMTVFMLAGLHAQIPPLINYQGRVAVNGTNFHGTGQFRFALVNGDGTQTFWSNDGTSADGSRPETAVPLEVAHGLYSVLLGDPAVAGMAALPGGVFANPDIRLRVWFDDGANGPQLLSPDQRLAPMPYLADGAVTSAVIANGAVTSANIAPGAVSSTHIAPGSLDFQRFSVPAAPAPGQMLTFDGQSLVWTTPTSGGGGGGSGPWFTSGATVFYNGGSVGLGTSTPVTKLTVAGAGAYNNPAAAAITLENTTAGRRWEWHALDDGKFQLADFNAAATRLVVDIAGNVGIGSIAPQSKLEVHTGEFFGITHTDGVVSVSSAIGESFLPSGPLGGWLGTSSNHPLYLYAAGTNNPEITIATSGNVGIGTTSPLSKLHISGFEPAWVEAAVQNRGGRAILALNSTVSGSNRVWTMESGLFGNPGWFGIYDRNALQARMTITPDGNVGIGTHDAPPLTKLHVRGSGFITEAAVENTSGIAVLALNSNVGGANRVWTLESGINGVPNHFGIYDRNAQKARLIIDEGGTVTVPVLQITGGADIAEPFPMKETSIEKGSVVVIDSDEPGRLKRSTRAYDRRVAGVISGANGIKPGIALHQEGAMGGDENVALSGRVYVAADASGQGIEPGDLLTTSETPGHAMKVTDYKRAQGAVLGKAMTSLSKGTKGHVLVLVTLQ